MRDMKPLPDRDPARAKLAAAIALHAGARRDVRVADEAASLAAQRCWDAQSRLEELRRESAAPTSARADAFIASVSAGAPCGTETIERSSISAHAKIREAENEFAVWQETRQECDLAAREKEDAVVAAKERVEKTARMIVTNSETVARLLDGVEEMTAEVINRRVALRFILFNGLNGELLAADREKIENLFRTDRLPAGFHSAYNAGWETHGVHRTWQAAFEELQSNSEAALPTEFAGVA
jgi:hypothetical protein